MRRRRTRAQIVRSFAIGAVRLLATSLIAVAFISLGIRTYLDRAWEPVAATNQLDAGPTPMERLQTVRHVERIEAAVEVYRLRFGGYPNDLPEVVNAGLLGGRALRYPNYREPYYYRRTGPSFVLYPPRY